jgi:hypothetical protein
MYTTKKGIRQLYTWIQKKCKRCHRFLGKYGQDYCSDCKILVKRELNALWMKENYGFGKERDKLIKFYSFQSIVGYVKTPIPRFIREELQCFM